MCMSFDSNNKKSAKSAAVRLLAARQYSAAGLTRKLTERGYDEDEIEAVIEYFTEVGYLNDLEFARSIVRHYAGKEPARIRYELYKRGIDRETMNEAIDGGDDYCEFP